MPNIVLFMLTSLSSWMRSLVSVSIGSRRSSTSWTLAHRIGDDAAMIEREIERIPVGDERRRCGIVSGVRVMAGCLYPIGDTDHVPPRVAMRIGINADERRADCDQAGFLGEFAGCCVVGRLAVFDITAGQRVPTREWWIFRRINSSRPSGRTRHSPR